MGNGDEVRVSWVCRGLHWLCLMMSWGPMVGHPPDIKKNWGSLSIRVKLVQHKVTIQVDPILSQAQVSLNSMARTLQREG